MELGIHVISFNFPEGPASIGPTLAAIGEAVETAGATHLSLMDHWFQMDRMAPAEHPMLEGYTGLGFLAAHTSKVRLGLLVTGVTYRHPGLLAKTAATLDVLSRGRGQLGIGAAWYEREHKGLGVRFPPVAERIERLEEAIRICLQMWDPDNNGPFEGRHYTLAETLCSPAPLSRPRPPILIGGSGEKKTLRLVTKYADACNLFASSPENVAHKLEVRRRHCDDMGRDPATVRTTILAGDGPLKAGNVDEFLRDMSDYARVGVDEVIVVPPDDRPAHWIEDCCGKAVSRLSDLCAD